MAVYLFVSICVYDSEYSLASPNPALLKHYLMTQWRSEALDCEGELWVSFEHSAVLKIVLGQSVAACRAEPIMDNRRLSRIKSKPKSKPERPLGLALKASPASPF